MSHRYKTMRFLNDEYEIYYCKCGSLMIGSSVNSASHDKTRKHKKWIEDGIVIKSNIATHFKMHQSHRRKYGPIMIENIEDIPTLEQYVEYISKIPKHTGGGVNKHDMTIPTWRFKD